MDHRKKIWLAAALGSLWIGLALWHWDAFTEPLRVPLTNVSGVAAAGESAKGKPSALWVNIGLLASARTQREATFTAPRNIFAVPRADGTLPVADQTGQPVDARGVSVQTLAQQAMMVELSQYRYLGFMRMGENRKKDKDLAVLSKNEEVVVVRVGDHVEDRFILKAISPDSVTLMNTGDRLEHTLPLSEEAPAQP